MLLTWLLRGAFRQSKDRQGFPRHVSRRRPPGYRAALEMLEDRLAPASALTTITITSDASTLAAALGAGAPSQTLLERLDTADTTDLSFAPAVLVASKTVTPVPPGAPAGTTVINIPPGDGENGYFKSTFTLPDSFAGVQLTGSANVDDLGRVFLNGHPLSPSLFSSDAHLVTQFGNASFTTENPSLFRPGENVLLVSDANTGSGPSGATFFAVITYVAGPTQATPIITWSDPPDITHGAALGTAQLNASANVPGSFSYTPPPGTVLSVGDHQPLVVAFTPEDTANYQAASATVFINVNEAPLPLPDQLRFSSSFYLATEDVGSAAITVVRTGDPSSPATVAYSTSAISATADTDYTPVSGTLTFDAGVTSITIGVPIQNDSAVEGDETFTVTLDNPTGSTLGGPSLAVITISENHGGSPNERFVFQLYADLLGREADAAGLAFFTSLLDQGQASRTQVALQIIGSLEYRTRLVEELYQRLLQRPADAAGLNYFLDFLAQGGSVDQLNASLAGSPEYYQNRGQGANPVFLGALFGDALEGGIDADTLSSYRWEMVNGLTPAGAATLVFTSTEYRQTRVEKAYQQFLHRSADADGLNYFVTSLEQGLSDGEFLAGITGSKEYYTAVNRGDPDERFVGQVFLDLLGRPVDLAGLKYFADRLHQAGGDRTEVALGVAQSEEYQRVLAEQAFQELLHRSADPAGQDYAVAVLSQGKTVGDLRASLAGSLEYFQTRGGGTEQGFVEVLYQDALNRAADAAALAVFVPALQGGATRAQVAEAIFGSSEYQRNLANDLYQQSLHRPGDLAGLDFFAGQLQQGVRQEQVIASMAGSPEAYAARWVQVDALSTQSAMPGRLLTIRGSGFDPTTDVSVRFFNDQGYTVTVPALDVEPTKLTVSVPPFLDPGTGAFGEGIVHVQSLKQSGGQTIASGPISGFQIQSLPPASQPAGTVLLAFLKGLVQDALTQQNAAADASQDTPVLAEALATQISALNTLVAQIQGVVSNPFSTFAFGTLDGSELTVGASDLLDADRLLNALLQADSSATSELSLPLSSIITGFSYLMIGATPFPVENVSPALAKVGLLLAATSFWASVGVNVMNAGLATYPPWLSIVSPGGTGNRFWELFGIRTSGTPNENVKKSSELVRKRGGCGQLVIELVFPPSPPGYIVPAGFSGERIGFISVANGPLADPGTVITPRVHSVNYVPPSLWLEIGPPRSFYDVQDAIEGRIAFDQVRSFDEELVDFTFSIVNRGLAGPLQAGSYSATVTITDPSACKGPRVEALIHLEVVEPKPAIKAEADPLDFSSPQGGPDPLSKPATVSNFGEAGSLLSFSISDDAPWLNVLGGTNQLAVGVSAQLEVSVNTAGLAAGTYTAEITFSDPNALNGPVTLPVTLTITEGTPVPPPPPPSTPLPTISVTPPSLTFAATEGGSAPAGQAMDIANTGEPGSVLQFEATAGASWLALSGPSSSVAAGQSVTWTVTANPAGLGAGTYNATITVSDAAATNTSQTIDVTLTIAPKPPAVNPFDGTYSGPFEGTTTFNPACGLCSPSVLPQFSFITFTIMNGVVTGTSLGQGTGSVDSNGKVTIVVPDSGFHGVGNDSFTFTGMFDPAKQAFVGDYTESFPDTPSSVGGTSEGEWSASR